MNHRTLAVVLSTLWLAAPSGRGADPTDMERLHQYRRSFNSVMLGDGMLTNFGATGCQGWFYWDRFHVCTVDKGSPADGIIEVGDHIIMANGEAFPGGVDPRPTFGRALTEAEANGGKLRLRIIHGAEERDVVVPMKPLGAYASAWPFDCAKSKRIYDDALSYVAAHQYPDGTYGMSISTAHDGLLLLTSDKPEYVEAARRAVYGRVNGPLGDGYWSWSIGYSGLLLAEYYLRTGDSAVLPRLREYSKAITSSQAASGSWGHDGSAYGIVGGYGEVNQAGISCFLAMILMREAGIEVDETAFNKSVDFFRRFAGAGCMHYGDGFAWQGNGENGLNAAGAIAYNLLGDTETMKEFAHTGARAFDLTEGCHTGSYWSHFWTPLGASLATDALFKRFMQEQAWYYDLCRRWDGAIVYIPHPESFLFGGFNPGRVWPTGGYGLVYAMPTRRLRILNAEPGVFGRRIAQTLEPARDLFKEKRWNDLDAIMSQWRGQKHSEAEKRDAADLLAARERTRDHLAWVSQRVGEALEQEGGDLYMAKVMLEAAERLNGAKLDFGEETRAVLQKATYKPKTEAQAKPKEEKAEKPKAPVWYNLLAQSVEERPTWRTHTWLGTPMTQPVMDNLHPAGAELADWYLPEFDDKAWKEGHLPMRDGPVPDPANPMVSACSKEPYQCYFIFYSHPFANRFLRTQFTLDDIDEVYALRLFVKGGARTEVYLNGYRVGEVVSPSASMPLLLAPESTKLLRKGKNTVAAYVAGRDCNAIEIELHAAGGNRSVLPPEPDVNASDIPWKKATCYWESVRKDRDVRGHGLRIDGMDFAKGIGMSAPGEVLYDLKPEYKRFVALVGCCDGSGGRAAMTFIVKIDGEEVAKSPYLQESAYHRFDVVIPAGAKEISLVTHHGESPNYDYAGWVRVGFMKE